jgi:hypothetical protein
MGWLRRFFLPRGDLAAANNALLAEHELSLVELVPENPFACQLATNILRTLTPLNDSDETLTREFNESTRMVQLVMVAHALAYIKPPSLEGESWHRVDDPFVADQVQYATINAFARRLRARHRVLITIPERHLEIVGGVLTDPPAADDYELSDGQESSVP